METPICAKCKHIRGGVSRKGSTCAAYPPEPTQPCFITGKGAGGELKLCWELNCVGQCTLFETKD